jgi:PAS domain S-box-containing protein
MPVVSSVRSIYQQLFVLGPIFSVVIFVAAMVAILWYLHKDEVQRERDNLRRDTEWVQQRIRIKLADVEDHLGRVAREMSAEDPDASSFKQSSEELLREHPMLSAVALTGAESRVRFLNTRTLSPLSAAYKPGERLAQQDSRNAFDGSRTLQALVYSRPFVTPENGALIEMHTPVQRRGYFGGVLVAVVSLPQVLRYHLPSDSAAQNAYTLLDSSGRELASSAMGPMTGALLTHEVAATPNGGYLYIRGTTFRTSAGLMRSSMFWIVISMAALILWVLGISWLQVRRRMNTQQQLMKETNFRRAMENSMSTGMRALDLQGRITYVNPAFCRMTGLSEDELVGKLPPYPYWPDQHHEELLKVLQATLDNEAPPAGFEVRIKKKDGSELDTRMYVSPLIDNRGKQFGYMTSMTDITEPKRVREELAASYERFTTVLEGLDAAVSVMALAQDREGEALLFANRAYRLWFGASEAAHLQLAGDPDTSLNASIDSSDSVDSLAGLPMNELTDGTALASECYVQSLDSWFDVRHRYMHWVDGRLVQMLIATDITSRRRAEEQARQQEERAEATSRLITMGEMASSLAHELNQPLTAINNYCVGIINRVKSNRMEPAALEEALQKTAKQAQRAAGIIKRIREFVKKSEPNRALCQIESVVDAALELADMELKKHNVRFEKRIQQGMPELWADRILIEQVLLNLIKNAAEAIDGSGRPYGKRLVRLKITRVPGSVQFEVRDSGPGLKDGMAEKLFESFYSTKAEGMGIGLNICRSIIEFHQGRLWAENDYNGTEVIGCIFRFTLPLQAGEPDVKLDLLIEEPTA